MALSLSDIMLILAINYSVSARESSKQAQLSLSFFCSYL